MTANTKIEWAHHTFNPWIGCTKVGPGCDHCYAETMTFKRLRLVTWGAGNARKRTSVANWRTPLRWNKDAAEKGIRYRVFCASLADVFDNEVPEDWRVDLFDLIRRTPSLDWLLLTKRIGNAAAMIDAYMAQADIGYVPAFTTWPWPNVWLGATVVNQEEVDRDIPKLLATPATKRFLSIEPMLGPIDLGRAAALPVFRYANKPIESYCGLTGRRLGVHPVLAGTWQRHDGNMQPWVDWVIAGGESGHHARPAHPDWFRSLRDQCEAAGVPFMFKQWGEWLHEDQDESGRFNPERYDRHEWPDTFLSIRVGKKNAGRILDGRTHDEFPQ